MIGKRNVVAMIGLTMLMLTGCVTVQPGQDQPNMRAALDALGSARASLVAAQANKGGHREAAIQSIDGAMAEVQAGIAYAEGQR